VRSAPLGVYASPDPEGRPLENGVRYVVVSIRDGLVVEMKACLNRQVALSYADAD
jgi:hypothetical protein